MKQEHFLMTISTLLEQKRGGELKENWAEERYLKGKKEGKKGKRKGKKKGKKKGEKGRKQKGKGG